MKDYLKMVLWSVLVTVISMTVLLLACEKFNKSGIGITYGQLFVGLVFVQFVATFFLVGRTRL